MSDNKKYYYMKLKDNFFDSEEMIVLESMTDGYLYSNILLKLYLRSLKDDGCLMFKGIIPYTPEVLAKVTRHNHGVVEKAIQIFKQLGLVEILDNGAIYMLDIQNFIGKSSTEADRIRDYRKKVDEQKLIPATNVITNDVQMYDKSTPEKEIEKEIEKTFVGQPDIPYSEIIDYLNEKAGTRFKTNNKATKEFINGRWSQGFRTEDFKTVIDKKSEEWVGTNMQQYLRPQTLFIPSNFESYLNQPELIAGGFPKGPKQYAAKHNPSNRDKYGDTTMRKVEML